MRVTSCCGWIWPVVAQTDCRDTLLPCRGIYNLVALRWPCQHFSHWSLQVGCRPKRYIRSSRSLIAHGDETRPIK